MCCKFKIKMKEILKKYCYLSDENKVTKIYRCKIDERIFGYFIDDTVQIRIEGIHTLTNKKNVKVSVALPIFKISTKLEMFFKSLE